LSAVHDCLFNLFAATLHIGGRSSIRNPRTRHAVVTGTHYNRSHTLNFIIRILYTLSFAYSKLCHSYTLRLYHSHTLYFTIRILYTL